MQSAIIVVGQQLRSSKDFDPRTSTPSDPGICYWVPATL